MTDILYRRDLPLQMVVAIPVKDEAERLGACLLALARAVRQAGAVAHVPSVVLLLNNCTDESRSVAEALESRLPFTLDIVEVSLSPGEAHAGGARRRAAQRASDLIRASGRVGAILNTDADSLVTADWVRAHARAFVDGAEAVAGLVRIDPKDIAHWPPHLRQREVAEYRYGLLLAEIAGQVDPDMSDPSPRHGHASGASLAVLAHIHDHVDGIPSVPVGEDRQFADRLRRAGVRLRHDPGVRVLTSGRFLGRACGGAADTISQRASDGGAPCDAALEPAQDALRRACLRRDMRVHYARGSAESRLILFGLCDDGTAAVQRATGFPAFWAELEHWSAALGRKVLRPEDLKRETRNALAIIRAHRSNGITTRGARLPADRMDDQAGAAILQNC